MRATITIPDERLEELMDLTGAETRTAAINVAIEAFVRQAKIGRLLALEGSVAILSNDEIEAMDAAESGGLWDGAPRGGTRD